MRLGIPYAPHYAPHLFRIAFPQPVASQSYTALSLFRSLLPGLPYALLLAGTLFYLFRRYTRAIADSNDDASSSTEDTQSHSGRSTPESSSTGSASQPSERQHEPVDLMTDDADRGIALGQAGTYRPDPSQRGRGWDTGRIYRYERRGSGAGPLFVSVRYSGGFGGASEGDGDDDDGVGPGHP